MEIVGVDVRWFDLAKLPWSDQGLEETLSSDERRRADRFFFPRDRRRFVRRRGALRILLADQLGTDPATVMLRTDAKGRPHLASEHRSPLRFNQSSSGDVAVCATTEGLDVGIDVEKVRGDFDVNELARRFFSPREVADLESLPEPARTGAFLSCWTLKEAFVKARGDGLRLPLELFDVVARPRTSPESSLVTTRWNPSEVAAWCVRALDARDGYVAAVAVAAPCTLVTVRVDTRWGAPPRTAEPRRTAVTAGGEDLGLRAPGAHPLKATHGGGA
jgi:4'-phosphopantetheinyl transferase